jgi:hypothetical protein
MGGKLAGNLISGRGFMGRAELGMEGVHAKCLTMKTILMPIADSPHPLLFGLVSRDDMDCR